MPSVYQCSAPCRPGYPVGQYGNGGAAFGTIACFVRERRGERRICLLSNQHILHYYQDPSYFNPDRLGMDAITSPHIGEILNEAYARINALGDAAGSLVNRLGGRGDAVVRYYDERRADYTAGSETAMIAYATIADYVRGSLGTDADAAIARLRAGTKWANVTPDGDRVRPPPDGLANVGDAVWKYGTASGKRKDGKIRRVTLDEPVVTEFTIMHEPSYPKRSSKAPALTKQKVAFGRVYEVEGDGHERFQVQGDSGSLLCMANGAALALMSIASFTHERRAYAFPIQDVFDALDVELPLEESGTASGSGTAKVQTLPLF